MRARPGNMGFGVSTLRPENIDGARVRSHPAKAEGPGACGGYLWCAGVENKWFNWFLDGALRRMYGCSAPADV